MTADDALHWIPFPSRIQPQTSSRSRGAPLRNPLDGFLAGPENRLAETAIHWVLEGIPNFQEEGAPLSPPPVASGKLPGVDWSGEPVGKSSRGRSKKEAPVPTVPPAQWPLEKAEKGVPLPKIIDYIPFSNVPYLSPLVFYGPAGSGKTHLVQGLYDAWRKIHPMGNGISLTGNDFYRSYTNALERDEMPGFRDFFAASAISVFEDIETLETHPAGQEELLALLENAEMNHSLVILSLSKYPGQIAGFSYQLTARLSGGLTVPVQYPSPESRRLLITRIADSLHFKLKEPVLDLLVQELPPGVGGMYGTLVQLCHQAEGRGQSLTPQSTRDLLEKRTPEKTFTVEEIAKKTSHYFSVRLTDMRGKSRMKTIVLSRNVTIYLARKLTNMTLHELGVWFAGRDHTTILHGYGEIESRLTTDPEIQSALHEISVALGIEK